MEKGKGAVGLLDIPPPPHLCGSVTGGDQGCCALHCEPFGPPEQHPASGAMCCVCVRFCLKKKLFATFSQWLLSLVSLPLAKS